MKKRNAAAAVFMAVAIAASVPLGINRSLGRMREDVEGEYYYDQAGYNIGQGIEERRAAAYDLVSLAEKYTGQSPELQGLIDELERQLAISENTWYDLTEDEALANSGLDGPAQALAEALAGAGLSDKDRKYPDQLINRMTGEQDKINRSSYNERAREYNAKVEGLKPMALLKPMADFSVPRDGITADEAVRSDTPPAEEAGGVIDGVLNGIFG